MPQSNDVLVKYIADLAYIQDQVGMTDWEKDFLSDMQSRTKDSMFTTRQKQSILNMVEKYGV